MNEIILYGLILIVVGIDLIKLKAELNLLRSMRYIPGSSLIKNKKSDLGNWGSHPYEASLTVSNKVTVSTRHGSVDIDLSEPIDKINEKLKPLGATYLGNSRIIKNETL